MWLSTSEAWIQFCKCLQVLLFGQSIQKSKYFFLKKIKQLMWFLKKGKECVSKFRSVSEICCNFVECQRKTLGKEVILPSVNLSNGTRQRNYFTECQMPTLDEGNGRQLYTAADWWPFYRGSRFAKCLKLIKSFFVECISTPSVSFSVNNVCAESLILPNVVLSKEPDSNSSVCSCWHKT